LVSGTEDSVEEIVKCLSFFFYADFSTKNGAKFITDKAAEHSKS
jgi:hypothetical protein